MNRVNRLLKNSMIFTIGNLGSKLITFILVPFFTYYLTTQEYGAVDLITTTTQLLVPIVSLGLTDSIIRFGLDSNYDQKKVFSNSLFIVVMGWGITSFILKCINFYYEIDFINILLVLIILQCLQILFATYLRSLEKIKLYTINSIFYTFLICMFSILFLKNYHLGVKGYFYAQIIATAISVIMLFFCGRLYQYFALNKYSRETIGHLIKFSIPLVPSGLSWWIINSASRYFILIFVGASGNGIFAVATKIPSLINLIQNIFIQAWQMTAIQEVDSKDKEAFFENVFNYYSSLFFIIIVLIISIQKNAIELLFNSTFYEAWKIIPFLLISSMFNSFSNFLGQIYISEKKTAGIFKTTMFSALFSLLINIIFIPLIGIIGAGIAQMLGWVMAFLYRYMDVNKFINIKLNLKKNFICLILLFSNLLMVYLLSNRSPLYWILQMLILLSIVIVNRDVLVELKKMIKRGIIKK